MINALEYWKAELTSKAPSTSAKYQEYFDKFLSFTEKTPEQLIAQRHQDLKADDPREQRGAENMLRAFMVKLQTDGKSVSTQQIAFAAVKSFYESNEYPLRTKKSDYPKGESLGSRAITKPVIRQILDDTKRMKDKLKMAALIMCAKDSGQGVAEIGNLTYGHVRKGLEANEEFIPLHLIRQKTKTKASPILGPEAVAALKAYLAERQEGTRRLEPEVLTDSSPLFRVNKAGPVKRISRGGLSSMLRFQCLKNGQVDLSAHSFRKYVQTALDVAGVSPNLTDRILGHKLGGSRDPYSQPSDEQLLEAYKTAYPQLRVYPDKVEIDQRVSTLETQIVEKNKVIADLVTNENTKAANVEALLRRVIELEKKLSNPKKASKE